MTNTSPTPPTDSDAGGGPGAGVHPGQRRGGTVPPPPPRGPGGWSSQHHRFEDDNAETKDTRTQHPQQDGRPSPAAGPEQREPAGHAAGHLAPPTAVQEISVDEGPDDPTDLPLFASTPTSSTPLSSTPASNTPAPPPGGPDDRRPGRVRSDFALRAQPGLAPAPGARAAPSPGPAQEVSSAGRRAHLNPPAPSSLESSGGARTGARVDWDQVAALRAQASDQLTAALEAADGRLDEQARRQLGRAIVQELLTEEVAEQVQHGRHGWTIVEQNDLATVLFDALFGLGRLQPLVDDERLENIMIVGCDNVWLESEDGTLVRGPAVAESDEQLIGDLVFLAERSQTAARTFSESSPRLHMRLPGGARLAAAAWVTPRPSVVIRRHRLRRVTFEDDLVPNETFSPLSADFLRACIRARKSVVVCGHQGAGKTTAVRALCACMDPWEAIGTFETEYELHLNELSDQHLIVHAWEARPGSGEVGINGRRAGEFTLDEALHDSFRFNLSRQIVGEVRGPEVWAMISAMEAGSGSLSTVHARDASAALRRLATCAQEAGPQVTSELAHAKLAETIDVIVHMHLETTPAEDGTFRRRRWVNEILAVEPGEDLHGWATTHVFAPNPEGGPAVPSILPDHLRRELAGYGFGPEKAREFQAQAQSHAALHPLNSVDADRSERESGGGGRV